MQTTNALKRILIHEGRLVYFLHYHLHKVLRSLFSFVRTLNHLKLPVCNYDFQIRDVYITYGIYGNYVTIYTQIFSIYRLMHKNNNVDFTDHFMIYLIVGVLENSKLMYYLPTYC